MKAPPRAPTPLPEGDGLSREKILGIWAGLESGRALPLAEDLRAVFSLALRAMPFPEGEAQALCTEVRKWIEETTRPTLSAVLTRCVETIERQAASLARLTGLLGHVREHITRDEDFDADELLRAINDSVDFTEFDRLLKRAEAAEASLASARWALQAIDDWRPKGGGFDDANDDPYQAMAVACKEIARAWLSSPRQEGT